jgi:hypothetical protein
VRTVDACLWGALEARSAVAAGPAGYRVVAVGSCRARSGGRSSPRKLQTISRCVSRVAHLPVKKMWSRSPPSRPRGRGSLISVTVRVRSERQSTMVHAEELWSGLFEFAEPGSERRGRRGMLDVGRGGRGAPPRAARPPGAHTRDTSHDTHTHTGADDGDTPHRGGTDHGHRPTRSRPPRSRACRTASQLIQMTAAAVAVVAGVVVAAVAGAGSPARTSAWRLHRRLEHPDPSRFPDRSFLWEGRPRTQMSRAQNSLWAARLASQPACVQRLPHESQRLQRTASWLPPPERSLDGRTVELSRQKGAAEE